MTKAQIKRWNMEAKILKALKEMPSCREMQFYLLERYGLKVNHNTINSDFKASKEYRDKAKARFLAQNEKLLRTQLAHESHLTKPETEETLYLKLEIRRLIGRFTILCDKA